MESDHGARHVQVARSLDTGLTWQPFTLCELDDYHIAGDNSIYYFEVRAVGTHEHALTAFFPAVIDGVGGLFMSTGDDGVRWSRPELLLPSPSFQSRTPDHPAGLIEHDDGAVSLWVLRNVDITQAPTNADRESFAWGAGCAWSHAVVERTSFRRSLSKCASLSDPVLAVVNGVMHCRCKPAHPPKLCAYHFPATQATGTGTGAGAGTARQNGSRRAFGKGSAAGEGARVKWRLMNRAQFAGTQSLPPSSTVETTVTVSPSPPPPLPLSSLLRKRSARRQDDTRYR
jgi:hypothetical protein